MDSEISSSNHVIRENIINIKDALKSTVDKYQQLFDPQQLNTLGLGAETLDIDL